MFCIQFYCDVHYTDAAWSTSFDIPAWLEPYTAVCSTQLHAFSFFVQHLSDYGTFLCTSLPSTTMNPHSQLPTHRFAHLHVSLCAKRYFETIASCSDYVGVSLFSIAVINKLHCTVCMIFPSSSKLAVKQKILFVKFMHLF